MLSILPIHVAPSPTDTSLELGLRRLSLYIDHELDLLVEIVRAGDLRRASDALDALSSLHLEADSTDRDTQRLLETARGILDDVLGDLRTMTFGDAVCAPAGAHDFDARIRWAGARLQDILTTLEWALD